MSGRDYLKMFNFPPLPFLSSEGEDLEEEEVTPLPLFSRCPITNEARLEKPDVSCSFLQSSNLKIFFFVSHTVVF
jgi:hypothetical protein